MGRPMGLDFGLENTAKVCKRKNRWLLSIEDVSAGKSRTEIKTLPPLKSARPNLAFQEMQAKHLNEDIYYPAKPDWKPISLVLYDVVKNTHPIVEWVNSAYNSSPQNNSWKPSVHTIIKQEARLELYDGCGEIIEIWVYENVWPQMLNFMDLDMLSGDILTCELTLRYARAYWLKPNQ